MHEHIKLKQKYHTFWISYSNEYGLIQDSKVWFSSKKKMKKKVNVQI